MPSLKTWLINKGYITCLCMIYKMLMLLPFYSRIGLIIIPIVSSLMNIHINNMLVQSNDTDSIIIVCLIYKLIFDYITIIIINNITYVQIRVMNDTLKIRLELAKVKCGIPIPGINQKQFKDLMLDTSKLRDFLYLIPIFWNSFVSFSISIYFMGENITYLFFIDLRLMFIIFCIVMVSILTYLTDPSLYEKTKPDAKSITRFEDSSYVKTKISMGCKLDTNFEINKTRLIEKQQNKQKYAVLITNIIITFISLVNKNIGQIHSFGNISWMLGWLADNLKSIKYYSYYEEFINLIDCFESHKLHSINTVPISSIDSVDFVNASFGYYDDLYQSNYTQKIFNLTYTFYSNKFYYLEAPNGIGKSTILRMFTSNLFSGDVFFGSINRNNLSFQDVISSVFHIVQASEYTPQFTREEIMACKGRDEWLEERLGLKELLNGKCKDTVEMSGGQKKRMFIYIVLTSTCSILLLDEILSELSTEDTPDVPEGGGWLSRVINTLAEWTNHNKIIIMVGHGLLDLIPKKEHIVNLKLENNNINTLLVQRV
jgi:ABC-type cobalamin/Fe3+-siderophores transport system ATPase subunit